MRSVGLRRASASAAIRICSATEMPCDSQYRTQTARQRAAPNGRTSVAWSRTDRGTSPFTMHVRVVGSACDSELGNDARSRTFSHVLGQVS